MSSIPPSDFPYLESKSAENEEDQEQRSGCASSSNWVVVTLKFKTRLRGHLGFKAGILASLSRSLDSVSVKLNPFNESTICYLTKDAQENVKKKRYCALTRTKEIFIKTKKEKSRVYSRQKYFTKDKKKRKESEIRPRFQLLDGRDDVKVDDADAETDTERLFRNLSLSRCTPDPGEPIIGNNRLPKIHDNRIELLQSSTLRGFPGSIPNLYCRFSPFPPGARLFENKENKSGGKAWHVAKNTAQIDDVNRRETLGSNREKRERKRKREIGRSKVVFESDREHAIDDEIRDRQLYPRFISEGCLRRKGACCGRVIEKRESTVDARTPERDGEKFRFFLQHEPARERCLSRGCRPRSEQWTLEDPAYREFGKCRMKYLFRTKLECRS